MWWGRGDGGERRVLGQIRGGGGCVMRTDGGGRKVVGQCAEYKVCLMGGMAGWVWRLSVPGVGLGVCVGVGVGKRQR